MLVIRFKVQCQPGKAGAAKDAFAAVIKPSRAVAGVINFDIAQDLDDPNCFIATEVFEDEAAIERQESLPEVANVLAVLGDALSGPPEATMYRVSAAEQLAY
jgi:quinol monooxygenase YgiN